MTKTLLLGTAQWGWTVAKHDAFALLDAWLAAGFRHIDCATNYPIDRVPAHFRAAEQMLREYIIAHGLRDLRVTMKIGSLDNLRSPEVNLAPSFVQMMGGEYARLFGSNLDCLMFHWDNRADKSDVQASLAALQYLQNQAGIRPGLSGIAQPETYAQANEALGLSFDIQLKHNVLHSDFARYAPLRNDVIVHRFFAYGINAGGVKIEAQPYDPGSTFLARGGQPDNVEARLQRIRALLPVWNTAQVRPPVKTMNHAGLILAGLHPGLSGILLGVSSGTQLSETLDFWRNLEVFDYSDVFKSLNAGV